MRFDWHSITMPMAASVALATFLSAQLVLLLQTFSHARTARKQREHDVVQGRLRREHEMSEATRRRAHERRVEAWRSHREAIASFVESLDGASARAQIAARLRHAGINVDQALLAKAQADELDARLRITYWMTLLPADLRVQAEDVARREYALVRAFEAADKKVGPQVTSLDVQSVADELVKFRREAHAWLDAQAIDQTDDL